MNNDRGRFAAWAWFLCLGLGAGCRGEPRGPSRLEAPDLARSRAALGTALDAWKAGRRAAGGLIGSGPAVGVVDSLRQERPLVDYEVAGPLGVVGTARPFAVRLVLGGPPEELTARYLVVGIDPLWVFRQEDYDRVLHWEHTMTDADPAGPDVR